MKIAQKYSHLNGEEYLIVHHKKLYKEIKDIIAAIDADDYKTKESKEARKVGRTLYSPVEINQTFKDEFREVGWESSHYSYYITTNRQLMLETINMPFEDQKEYLLEHGEKNPIYSFNQTDFVKDKLAVEVQFGKYSFVAYDLFVKHMMFFSGGVINLGALPKLAVL